MASATINSRKAKMIVTLEGNALISDIKKALKMIRGVASVRVARHNDDNVVTPALRRAINKARRDSANGETFKASTPVSKIPR